MNNRTPSPYAVLVSGAVSEHPQHRTYAPAQSDRERRPLLERLRAALGLKSPSVTSAAS